MTPKFAYRSFLAILPAIGLWLWDAFLRPQLSLHQSLAVLFYFTSIALLCQFAVSQIPRLVGSVILALVSLWFASSTYFNSEYFNTYASFIAPEEIRVITQNLSYWAATDEINHSQAAVSILALALVLFSTLLLALRSFVQIQAKYFPLLCVGSLGLLSLLERSWYPADLNLARSLYISASQVSSSMQTIRSAAKVAGTNEIRQLPNIIMVVTESLRADHLPQYGYSRNTMPNFQEKFPDALAYTAIASATVTPPAVGGILSGRHSGYTKAGASESPLVWSFMKQLGYQTFLFSSHWYEWNDGKFYDYVVDERSIDRISWPKQPIVHGGREDIATTEALIDSINKASGQPLFAVLHLRDQHFVPLASPENILFQPSFATRDPEELHGLINLYDNSILSLDRILAGLFTELGSEYLSNTMLILTSDHGEAFFEHGMLFHTTVHYREVLEVPLLIHLPRGIKLLPEHRANLELNQQSWVSVTDILPTMLDLIGATTTDTFDGKSLTRRRSEDRCLLTFTNPHHYTVFFPESGYKAWVDNRNLKMRISRMALRSAEEITLNADLSSPVRITNLIEHLKNSSAVPAANLTPEKTACITEFVARSGCWTLIGEKNECSRLAQ